MNDSFVTHSGESHYRVLIVGAGYLGSLIAAHFGSEKQKVWAVIRTDARKKALEQMGVIPIVADILRPQTLAAIPAAQFIVICVTPQGDDPAAYHETYVDGVGNMLRHIKTHAQPSLVVYVSNAEVYGNQRGKWLGEDDTPRPDDFRGEIFFHAEQQVLGSELPVAICRLGEIYGPSRNWIPAFKWGVWESKKDDPYMNMIHVEDAAAFIPVLFDKGEYGKVYVGVDDRPVLRSEFTKWMNKKLGIKNSDTPQRQVSGKRLKNTRLKALGFKFRYPDFEKGYADLIRNTSRELNNARKRS